MNLITRTRNNLNDTMDVRKSQRVPKKPKFLKEYVTADFEDNTFSYAEHPDLGYAVDTTENNDDVQTIFDKLFNLVEQWQQELIDSMEKVDHDDYTFLNILNKYVTDSSYNSDDIEEASTCRLSIDIKRKSPERDEMYSVPKYLDDINKLNCINFDGMGSLR